MKQQIREMFPAAMAAALVFAADAGPADDQEFKAQRALFNYDRYIYVSRVDTGIIAKAAGTTNRKFYETDHAMTLPEIAADRDAFLLKELAAGPGKDF